MQYFEFEARVEYLDMDSGFTVVYLPDSIVEDLPVEKTSGLRVEGEINEVPFNLALHPKQDRRYLIVSKKYLKTLDVTVGDRVEVYFKVADQDFVDVPEELKKELQTDARAQKKWDKLTPGKRRSFAYMVTKAKRPETKEKRIREIFQMIKAD